MPRSSRGSADKAVPGVAQGGIQGGKYAAGVIRRRVLGRPYEPFRYSDRGDVAVIGRLSGVTNIGWLGPFGRQGGFTAWALWLGIHIVYLIGFANRIVVLTRWAWTFITHGRSTRLITGGAAAPRSRSRSRRSSPDPDEDDARHATVVRPLRQLDQERRPVGPGPLHLDPSAVRREELAGDGQAEAGAARVGRSAGPRPARDVSAR